MVSIVSLKIQRIYSRYDISKRKKPFPSKKKRKHLAQKRNKRRHLIKKVRVISLLSVYFLCVNPTIAKNTRSVKALMKQNTMSTVINPLATIASYSSFNNDDDDDEDNNSTNSVVDELDKEIQKLSRDADRILDSIRNVAATASSVKSSSSSSSNNRHRKESPPLCTETTTSEEDFDNILLYDDQHDSSDDEYYYDSEDDVDYALDKLQKTLLHVDDMNNGNSVTTMSPMLVRRRRQSVHDDTKLASTSHHTLLHNTSSHSLRSSVHGGRRSLQTGSLHHPRTDKNQTKAKINPLKDESKDIQPILPNPQQSTPTIASTSSNIEATTGVTSKILTTSFMDSIDSISQKVEDILYQFFMTVYHLKEVDDNKETKFKISQSIEIILIVAVTIVWGTIFYLLYRALHQYTN